MSLQNINRKQKDHGFTIVELLVVVVVIGILAAITIVSYTGITARANTAAGIASMNAVTSKATVYSTDGPTTSLPISWGSLTGAAATTTYYLASSAPTGVDFTTASNNVLMSAYRPASISNDSIDYIVCGTTGTTTGPTKFSDISVVSGLKAGYWDYSLSTPAENVTSTVGYTSGNYPTSGSNPVGCYKVGLAEATIAVAQAIRTETGAYPATAAAINANTAASAKLPLVLQSNVLLVNPTVANGTVAVKYECATAVVATLPCLNTGNAAGGRITYWDYNTNATNTIAYGVYGQAVPTNFAVPAS
ncbi:MAG: prepilin-type N-terminal cleavage/methylation domain-containing protein [Candidatus Saccharibacteria bacterium]